MLVTETPRCQLHVFGPTAPEPIRHVMFRDWLRTHPDDLALYQATKLAAAEASNAAGEHGRGLQPAEAGGHPRLRPCVPGRRPPLRADRAWIVAGPKAPGARERQVLRSYGMPSRHEYGHHHALEGSLVLSLMRSRGHRDSTRTRPAPWHPAGSLVPQWLREPPIGVGRARVGPDDTPSTRMVRYPSTSGKHRPESGAGGDGDGRPNQPRIAREVGLDAVPDMDVDSVAVLSEQARDRAAGPLSVEGPDGPKHPSRAQEPDGRGSDRQARQRHPIRAGDRHVGRPGVAIDRSSCEFV